MSDYKPSLARLAMSHSMRLRQLAAKAWQSYDRFCKKNKTEEARQAMKDHKALEAGANQLRDFAMAEAKRTGESLS
jgi:hypothetical protein